MLALVSAVLMAVEVAGLYRPQPLEREDMWLGLSLCAAVAVVCAGFAFRGNAKGMRDSLASAQGRPEPTKPEVGFEPGPILLRRPRCCA